MVPRRGPGVLRRGLGVSRRGSGSLWGGGGRERGAGALPLCSGPGVTLLCCPFADDELSLLIIVLDTNPIWWGKRALGEAEVRPSGAGMLMAISGGNCIIFFNLRTVLMLSAKAGIMGIVIPSEIAVRRSVFIRAF